MERELRKILTEVGGLSVPTDSLSVTDDLFAAGLTSFATVSVMLAIEGAFAVEFPDSLLVRSTFSSVDSLMDAITGLREVAHA